MVYLFTGLPGTGKTTAALKMLDELNKYNIEAIHLDGDNMRKCWPNIGYTTESRLENISRIKDIAKLFHDANKTVIVSVVAPSSISRKEFRDTFGDKYIEIYMDTIWEKRPPHYYPTYEPSESAPEFVGEKGLQQLLKNL